MFCVTLTAVDPMNASRDKLGTVRAALAKHYQGVCYQGVWIQRIRDVLRVSDIRVELTRPTVGVVDVEFSADVCQVQEGDLLPRVDVVSPPGAPVLVGRVAAPPVAVSLSGGLGGGLGPLLAAAREAGGCPARVYRVQHMPMLPTISAIAFPFAPQPAPRGWVVAGGAGGRPARAAALAALREALAGELAWRAGERAARVEEVERALYPWRAAPGARVALQGGEWRGVARAPPAPGGLAALADLSGADGAARLADGPWHRPDWQSEGLPGVLPGEPPGTPPGPALPVVGPAELLEDVLGAALRWLRFVRGVCEGYASTDPAEPVWRELHAMQRD